MGPYYLLLLMVYRATMGVVAIVNNIFFIHVLRIFPIKDRSGYYKVMRPLLCFLAMTDLVYGLCITTQVILYYEARSSYLSHSCLSEFHSNTTSCYSTLEEYLLGPENTLRSYSNVMGIIRQSTVKGNVTYVFLITLTRMCLTLYPLQSMRRICRVTSKMTYLVLSLTLIPALLLNKNIFTSSEISDCYGLLVCESSDPVSCSLLSVLVAGFSLLICTLILVMILKTWVFALQKKREAERLLQLSTAEPSKNFKSVKVSLGISLVFLLSNSGPSLNNAVKLLCLATNSPQLEVAYYVGDVAEQWLLPLMTVLNCVVYTTSNKAVRKFTQHYYHLSFLSFWKKYKSGFVSPRTVSSVSYGVDVGGVKIKPLRGARSNWKDVLRREFYNTSL